MPSEDAEPTAAGPCAIVADGTPAPKTSALAPAGGTATTSRNISTNPEVATGYRKDMTAGAHQQLFGGDRQPAGHPGSL